MTHRVINGLRWARLSSNGPFKAPRARGRKGQGLKYERDLAKALPSASHGQWIEYEDRNGPGWAQPDFLLPLDGRILILETKYTYVAEAHAQVDLLYRPLCEALFNCPIKSIIVVKVLTPECRAFPIYRTIDVANEALKSAETVLMHWIGSGPLFLPKTRSFVETLERV